MVRELQSLGLAASPKTPHPRQLTYADLAELGYLKAVVKVPSQDICGFPCSSCVGSALLWLRAMALQGWQAAGGAGGMAWHV